MARVELVRFQLNRTKKGIAGLAVSRKIRDAVGDIATQKALPFAVAASPNDSGSYKGSWRVHDVTVHGIPRRYPMTRAGARLANHDPGAAAIEHGSARRTASGQIVGTPAHRVLGKTLEHLDATAFPRHVRRRR